MGDRTQRPEVGDKIRYALPERPGEEFTGTIVGTDGLHTIYVDGEGRIIHISNVRGIIQRAKE
ncbi:MAG: hypothetical protein R3346_02985 [Candidatus Spechtbacterales bacterium]|nr:hypothetical protein [Candidatus Spechtbacterales bacterium]